MVRALGYGVSIVAIWLGLSPTALAQETPVARIEAAKQAAAAEDWDTARRLYGALTDAHPWSGPFWHQLGRAEFREGDPAAAIRSFERGRETGHRISAAAFEIAAAHVALGETSEAVDWLNRATAEGLTNIEYRIAVDPRFQPLRADSGFQENFLPVLPNDAARADQWRRDLQHLDRMYRLVHYAPFGRLSEADWIGDLSALSSLADTASDAEMSVGLMKLFARVGDGHSFVFAPFGQSLFGVVNTPRFFSLAPVDFYQFGDEIRVIGASEDAAPLLGARVTKLAGQDIATVRARVAELISGDNVFQVQWMVVRYLGVPEVLHALGLSASPDSFEIEAVRDDGSAVTMTLEGLPFSEDRLARAIPSLAKRVIPEDPAERPLTFRRVEEPFSIDWLAEERLLVVQVNTIADAPEETLETFGRRLTQTIGEHRPRALVLDLRWNSGGDSFLNGAILGAIAGSSIDRPGRLFTIIGRKTFSAAVNLTSALRFYTNTLLVGEPSGAGPNFIGEINSIQLPNTGMFVTASSRYHQGRLSDDKDLWWSPDLPAEPTWASYRDGVDPALTAIRAYLTASETPPAAEKSE